MNNFTFTHDECKEETTSTWLISVIQFRLKANIFKPFEIFKLKMKQVKYSIYRKLIITMMSIVIGCETARNLTNLKDFIYKRIAAKYQLVEIITVRN